MAFVVHLREEEALACATALSHITQLGSRETFDLVERNYEHLVSVVEFYERIFSQGRRGKGGVLPHDASSGVMAAIINWLSTSRLFLDHERTRLSREYGSKSSQLARFVRATNMAFDESAAYRFLYRFRNYVLHCGLPVAKVDISRPDDAGIRRGTTQQIRFLLDRDELLRSFDWASAKQTLSEMEPTFSIVELVREAMPRFREIMKTVVREDIRRAAASAPIILDILNRSPREAADTLSLVHMIPNGRGGYQISSTLVPVGTVEQLATLTPEGDPLILLPPPTRPRDVSPTDAGFLYRLQRGVTVISSWIEGGGGTPEFFKTVERLVNEDNGSVEPLATGVLNIAATLLSSTSTAVGVSGQSLLSRIADDGLEYI